MKYNKIMENIKVTPDMRERILKNLEKHSSKSYGRFFVPLAACVIAAVCVVSVYNYNIISDTPLVQDEGIMQECNSIDELSVCVGFDVKNINNVPFEVKSVVYMNMFGTARVEYTGESNTLTFNMAEGSNEDISGNYNEFDADKSVDGVTIKGSGGLYSLALWQDDGYSYSVDLINAVDENTIMSIVKSIE